MLKAVLFDLDNTLILFEEVSFLQGYYPVLAARFQGIFPDGQFAERLMRATVALRKGDGTKINRQLFIEVFCDGIDVATRKGRLSARPCCDRRGTSFCRGSPCVPYPKTSLSRSNILGNVR